MKQNLSLLALLGLSSPAFAEERVRIPEVTECFVGDRVYRVENAESPKALFQVYDLSSPKKEVLIDSFAMNDPDQVYGKRLDFLLDYDLHCGEKQ